MANKTNKNIFAIESSWDGRMSEPRSGMKSLMDFIMVNRDFRSSYFHSFVNTREELTYILENTPVNKFSLLYVGTHGSPNKLQMGMKTEYEITLDDLANIMKFRFSGYAVYFASCAVLNVEEEVLRSFKDKTGISFICGYTKFVDFYDSSVVDLAVLQAWARARNYRRMFEKMMSGSYKQLMKENGFRYFI